MMKGGKSSSLTRDFRIGLSVANRGHDQKMWLRSSASSPHGHVGDSVRFLRKRRDCNGYFSCGKRGDLVPGKISGMKPWFGGIGASVVYVEGAFGAVRVSNEFEETFVVGLR